MRVEAQGYTGKVSKSATVYTNEPQGNSHTITLEAFIRPLISIMPESLFLEGQTGQVVKGSVQIRAEAEKELHLEPVQFDLESKVVYSIEEVKPGKLFMLHFSNVPGLTGMIHGTLRLKTNYPEKPEVNVRIRCRFRE